jgi:Zn-dependent peptidase ImmA (M78 family)
MNIEIFGFDTPELIHESVTFFCDVLDLKNLNISIYADDCIEVATGICYYVSDDEFQIVIKNRDIGHMCVTLAHELTHVKQYVKDQLDDHFNTSIPYHERWWEIEAYENEVKLTQLFVEKISKKY